MRIEAILGIAISVISIVGSVAYATTLFNEYGAKIEAQSTRLDSFEENQDLIKSDKEDFQDKIIERIDNLFKEINEVKTTSETTKNLVQYYIAPRFGAPPTVTDAIQTRIEKENKIATTT